jgi:hypothetical protein
MVPADKAREAAVGEVGLRGFYSRIPTPETTWDPCATCGTPARILSTDRRECIRCQVARARAARTTPHPTPSGGEIAPPAASQDTLAVEKGSF